MAIPAPRTSYRTPHLLPKPLALAVALAAALLATGCQQNKKQVSMVDPLPPPSFPPRDLQSPVGRPQQSLPAAQAKPAKPLPAKPAPVVAAAVPPGIPREWVPVAAAGSWRWIVIHHSATGVGGATRFDKMHREVHHWDELGYHFVVGNGTDTRDGAVEVGSRWPKQKWGAHAKTADNKFNEQGIGICLVGDFDKTRPTDAQMRSLAKLVAYLQKTYRIPGDRIIGHGDTKATDCPGKNMRIASVRRMSAQLLADAGETTPDAPTRTASAATPVRELLVGKAAR